MDPKPFASLKTPRIVNRDDLPPELIRFYERNEGVGLRSSSKRIVRLCRLAQVREHAWRDVPIFGNEEEIGWEGFRGLYIGVSSYHDDIYWARSASCCPDGSILTFGPDVAGPGGEGEYVLEPSLVLASNFDGWLPHLARHDWFEYGLAPGEIWELPNAEQSELRAYYAALNPGIPWPFG